MKIYEMNYTYRKIFIHFIYVIFLAVLLKANETLAFDDGISKRGLILVDYGRSMPNPPELPDISWISNPNFASFVNEIGSALHQNGLQPDGLRIIRLPLFTAWPRVLSLKEPSVSAVCVKSPWAHLFHADGRIGGHILWSERQFLRDRLGQGDWETPPLPLSQEEFLEWAEAYAFTIMGEESEKAMRIPADLNRLFQEAPQVTRRPFDGVALGYMQRISQEMSNAYAEPILDMIQHCAEGRSLLRLQTPADLAATFGASAYSEFAD